jgi:hypothetical protein
MLRIGHGFDVHAFAEGRRLVLGGVDIPHARGLDGHSDADVLTHALMDALLGAARAEDIGTLFPDTDPAYEGADSLALLAHVAELLRTLHELLILLLGNQCWEPWLFDDFTISQFDDWPCPEVDLRGETAQHSV